MIRHVSYDTYDMLYSILRLIVDGEYVLEEVWDPSTNQYKVVKKIMTRSQHMDSSREKTDSPEKLSTTNE